MPKRNDIKKIMLIGAGPIAIGQGCEFDYSGVQACKALKSEGYEVVLVNSNPATIMTDPEFADRTYIEPLTVEVLSEIIRRERPDALLPTLGGQTALNLAIELAESQILAYHNVELIGANAQAIRRAEDRQMFKEIVTELGLELPRSGSAHTLAEAQSIAGLLGKYPLIIRPGFTLGGAGGGIAHNAKEFEEIVARGLAASRNREVLIEESLLGWKEFELEVIRDRRNNSVIVCSIENLDPMGVHTGDSITVAPAQTLTDREYQLMRDNSLRVMAAIGVETGGSNVQWAVNPRDGRQVIIEMNPRVSRSSALASKATGFPIAKIATLLAVGYTLDELQNDITRVTPSCFEPALDYVVVKVPRFTFEKFPAADTTLGTQMKSVGEAMAIGRGFKEALQKALRSLETGRGGFGADGRNSLYEKMDAENLAAEIARPHAERIFALYEGLKRGWTVEKLFDLTQIDRYFLRHLEELARFETTIKLEPEMVRQAKKWGYSDRQLSFLSGQSVEQLRTYRKQHGITPTYGLVDTCAGEFAAITPYYYSSYTEYDEPVRDNGGKKSIMILGGGPNRIGQGIEFDYCCVHAAFALKEAGYITIMVNSNPETVSTDYDTSDKLYFEPLTAEDILNIYEREQCDGVIVQFGGQTPLNLAAQLQAAGVKIIGTSPDDINRAEDRDFFKQLADKLGIKQPASGIAHNVDEAIAVVEKIGYPVLVRPSFVLGGRAMVIVYKDKYLRQFVEAAAAASEGKPILLDRFLEEATEVDVDFISDGENTVIGAVMEHVELAGIHSGDSACSIPARTLSPEVLATIKAQSAALAKELNVCGLINIQFAVRDNEVYILEVNPRASRTVPFVSKAIGVPLAKKAALCMVGKKLPELRFTQEVQIPYMAFKEAVFPFIKFPGVDIVLSPEMKSTGEVMGLDYHGGLAYLKAQIAANNAIPPPGSGVFISLRDADKEPALPLMRQLVALNYQLYCTRGTATWAYNHDLKCQGAYRISEGRPSLLDLIAEGKVQWIINTPEAGAAAMVDEIQMRSGAVMAGIPITTTLSGFTAAIDGLRYNNIDGHITVCSLQEYQRRLGAG
ncbi:MAG: carbamoyl-phosphate synthase large subunit [Planctomycetota bacterium]|jgi:carbamoyl-phosphate synthase large subunit|nr:carbamoyl-phosphate synthase large subunit [Planctomycetota bacterium]